MNLIGYEPPKKQLKMCARCFQMSEYIGHFHIFVSGDFLLFSQMHVIPEVVLSTQFLVHTANRVLVYKAFS